MYIERKYVVVFSVLTAVIGPLVSLSLPAGAPDVFTYVGGETGIRLYEGKVVPDSVPAVYGSVTRLYWPEITLSYCGAFGYRSLSVTSANDVFVGGGFIRPHLGAVISYGYLWPARADRESGGGRQNEQDTRKSEVRFGGGVGFLYGLDGAGSFVAPRFFW